MRVLHIYSGNFYGGVESLLVTLARYRNLRPSLEPHYALAFEGRLSQDLRQAGVPVYTLGGVRVSRPASIWNARRSLGKLLETQPFDSVICHSPWPHLIFGPVVRSMGKPLGFWLHDATDGRHWSERWARRTQPDFAICNSEFTRTTLRNIHPRTPSVVIHSPVASVTRTWTEAELAAARAGLETSRDDVVIIQPSRMEEWKGHRLHLEALALLKDVPKWTCWMIGKPQRPHEDAYYQALKTKAQELGIANRVRFAGWVPDLQVLLAAAQIHCQPNTGPEPLGLTFLEAMAARLPVITTAIGGAREIVNETCGILTPPNDRQALAAGLGELISDPLLRKRLGEAGPARAKELCDPHQQIVKLERTIASYCGGRVAA